MIRYIHIASLLLLLVSCRKDRVEILFEIQEVAGAYQLQEVYFSDEETGYAVGGITYKSGVFLQTLDGGQSWLLDSLNDNILQSIYLDFEEDVWLTGFNGYTYELESQSPADPIFYRLPVWNQMQDLTENEAGQFISISGVGYVAGEVFVWNPNFALDTLHEFPFALTAIDRAPDGRLHLAGYGAILRSEDGGKSWIRNPIEGDFFQDIHFPSADIGYAVGYAGTILKTEDGGETWGKLRNGGSLWVPDVRFKTLYFSSPEVGVLAGEGGCFWRTNDGGETWEVAKNAPDLDFLDVFIIDNIVWLTTREGMLVKQ